MKKQRILIALLALGSALFCAFTGGSVKADVYINGVAVGGLPYTEATERVRAVLPCTPFTLNTPEGDVFPLNYSDDLGTLVRKAKRGEHLTVTQRVEWMSAEQDIAAVCKKYSFEPSDARVSFSADGTFTYTPDRAGVACDYMKTLEGALRAVREGKTSSPLYAVRVRAKTTVRDLRARTRPLASFTTYFDGAKSDRVHNIALACSAISGTVIESGGTFSFNETVGARTEERGYRAAPVIFDGEFVAGIGGGVCQVSTTLMNCAVRAGLTVTSSHAHSLTVGYVPPSCDAMVSEYSDLEFKNDYAYPVYICAKTGSNSVTFTIYGKPDGKRYALESNVLLRIAPPSDKIVEGEEEKIVRQAKEGLASESYLAVYEGETLVSKTLFRRDTYGVVQGIRQIKKAEEEEVLPEEPVENPPCSPNV